MATKTPDLEAQVFIALERAADRLMVGLATLLKPSGLSPTQYNVLRILRGAGQAGLACNQIGDRMLTHDPDITRLLDRLEKAGLVERAREGHDRRVITVRVTARGLAALEPLDGPVAELHRMQLGHLGESRLRELLASLERARERAAG